MRVASIMTEKVLKVRMDDSIGTMREILENIEFHHLLVVEDRKPVGILSDRDILRVISPFLDTLSEHDRDLSILKKRVHQIMTRKLITVNKDTSIKTATSLFALSHKPSATKRRPLPEFQSFCADFCFPGLGLRFTFGSRAILLM